MSGFIHYKLYSENRSTLDPFKSVTNISKVLAKYDFYEHCKCWSIIRSNSFKKSQVLNENKLICGLFSLLKTQVSSIEGERLALVFGLDIFKTDGAV